MEVQVHQSYHNSIWILMSLLYSKHLDICTAICRRKSYLALLRPNSRGAYRHSVTSSPKTVFKWNTKHKVFEFKNERLWFWCWWRWQWQKFGAQLKKVIKWTWVLFFVASEFRLLACTYGLTKLSIIIPEASCFVSRHTSLQLTFKLSLWPQNPLSNKQYIKILFWARLSSVQIIWNPIQNESRRTGQFQFQ